MQILTDKYVPTIHWGTTKDGFDSVVTLYNYYGYAFHNSSKEQTDSDVIINFFDEGGNELQEYRTTIETGGTLHIPISKIHKDFRGVVATTMCPVGDMPRISWKEGNPHKPIATSYFMLYEKQGGYRDFSHELFSVKKNLDKNVAEWATILYVDKQIKPGFVVMNNRLYGTSEEYGSDVSVQLCDLKGAVISESYKLRLSPGGSRFLLLDEVFPGMKYAENNKLTVVIRGNNIEQPMSMHLHDSGDFNIHHF